MGQKEPDFIDRFADRLARAAERMKSIETSPEYKRKQRRSRAQIACVLLFGFPMAMLLVVVGQRLGWSKLVYFPLATVAIHSSILLAPLFSKGTDSGSVSN